MDSTDRSVISALKRDHRQIEQLLARLQAAADPETRRRLRDGVTGAMVQHADAEDKYLYPVIRSALPRGAMDIEKQIRAHAKVKEMLEDLKRADVAGCEFEQLVMEIIAEVHQNILDEEDGVFAWLVQWVDENTLAALGDEMQMHKELGATKTVGWPEPPST
jgi:hemerythrin superfamily protein